MVDGARSAFDGGGDAATTLNRSADRLIAAVTARRRVAREALDTWSGPTADAFRDDLRSDDSLAEAAADALSRAATALVEGAPIHDPGAGTGGRSGGWR